MSTYRLLAGNGKKSMDAMHTQIAQRATAALLRIEHPGHVPITVTPGMPINDAEVEMHQPPAVV